MDARIVVLTLAIPAVAITGLSGGVAAQPTPPAKSNAATPPADPTPANDAFLPPLRGTPDGRVSGGTRGLELPPGTPATSPGSHAPATPRRARQG